MEFLVCFGHKEIGMCHFGHFSDHLFPRENSRNEITESRGKKEVGMWAAEMGKPVKQKGHSARMCGVGKVMRCSWEGSLNERDREELLVDGGWHRLG